MRIGSEGSAASAASEATADESRMRVLLVVDCAALARELRELLGKSTRCAFEVLTEADPDRIAGRAVAQSVDLLLIDLALAGRGRGALVDRASELATRLPVVLLTGTESLDPAESPVELRLQLEEADLPSLLLRTLRRARRLGTTPLPPAFCRLEGLAAEPE